MKSKILTECLLFICFINSATFWSQGRVWESLSFFSPSLGKECRYSIYLPDSLAQSDNTYPVIYLLHGFSGNETDWIKYGNIGSQVHQAIREGKMPPSIIVMPDGKNSWYINSPLYGNYEDMIIQDLIPYIEKKYGSPGKGGRAVIGLSMGGNAAFRLSMKYPELFSSCVALSGSFWSVGYYTQLREKDIPFLFHDVYGKNPLTSELWKQNNPFDFMQEENSDRYNSVRILFDCGDDDHVVYSQLELSNFLHQMKIKHELRIRDGIHNWEYWKNHVIDAMIFCSKGFHLN